MKRIHFTSCEETLAFSSSVEEEKIRSWSLFLNRSSHKTLDWSPVQEARVSTRSFIPQIQWKIHNFSQFSLAIYLYVTISLVTRTTPRSGTYYLILELLQKTNLIIWYLFQTEMPNWRSGFIITGTDDRNPSWNWGKGRWKETWYWEVGGCYYHDASKPEITREGGST